MSAGDMWPDVNDWDRFKASMKSLKSEKSFSVWNRVVDRIIAGKVIYNGEFYNMIQSSVAKVAIMDEKKTSYLERVVSIHKHFPYVKFMELVNALSKDVMKNDILMYRLKEKADKLYKMSNFGSALLCYNLALSYAPTNSVALGRIYGSRGSLFLRKMDVDNALKDTEEALWSMSGSAKERTKLKEQRLVCVGLTKKQSTPESSDEQRDPESQAFYDNVIFKIDAEEHPTMPAASTSVKMKYSEERGRHLVAAKDIETGTTVIVERPYVSVIDNGLEWEMKHCFWCYKRIWRTVPCPKCVFAIYCDEKCKMEDYNEGHRYMCPCMPFLHVAELDAYDHLSLKAVCRAGPKSIYELFLKSKMVKVKDSQSDTGSDEDSNTIKGFDPDTGVYASDSYYPMMFLTAHFEKADLDVCAWVAIAMAKILNDKSDFFMDIPNIHQKSFQHYVSSLIFQNTISFPFNGVALRKSLGTKQRTYTSIRQQKDKEGITGIFSLISMMNHGCEPTIIWTQSRDGTLAIVTRQKIKAGGELLFSYGFNYSHWDLDARQFRLLKGYRFNCNCIACNLKWLPFTKLLDAEKIFLCSNCVQQKHSRLFLIDNCGLKEDGKNGICGNCDSKFRLSTLINEASKHEQLMSKADELMTANKNLEAIPHILECIKYFQTNMKPPSPHLLKSQEMLWYVYGRIIDL